MVANVPPQPDRGDSEPTVGLSALAPLANPETGVLNLYGNPVAVMTRQQDVGDPRSDAHLGCCVRHSRMAVGPVEHRSLAEQMEESFLAVNLVAAQMSVPVTVPPLRSIHCCQRRGFAVGEWTHQMLSGECPSLLGGALLKANKRRGGF